jgi:hypothetical protein
MLKRLSNPKFKPLAWETLDGALPVRASGAERPVVSIVRCGTRALDPDNLRGSVKALVDQLRYSGLIPEDTEAAIDLRVGQIKVTKDQVATYVKIDFP